MLARAPTKPAKVGKAGSGVVTSIRFDPPVKAAIDKAAKSDKRSISSLVQKVMEEWLKAKGFLK
jgi:hypothetical protein